MPCRNLIQVPEECLQGRHRFLAVQLEVDVVSVFPPVRKAIRRRTDIVQAYVRVSSSSRLAIALATEVFPTPLLPVKRIADTTILCSVTQEE